MKNTLLFAATLFCLFTAGSAFADDVQRALAVEYLQLSKTPEMLENTIEAYVQQLAASSPEADVDGLREFFNQTVSWEALQAPATAIVAEILTAEELAAINAFYKTEQGKAYAEKSPALSVAIAQVVSQNVSQVIATLPQNKQ